MNPVGSPSLRIYVDLFHLRMSLRRDRVAAGAGWERRRFPERFRSGPAKYGSEMAGSKDKLEALEPALPTRHSLLSRLKSWDEQDSWREFFETYWRLIFDTARKAGLDEASAQDVVQETVVSVAKEMPGFRYDRSRGSFKGWLLLITKRRIADAFRRRYRRGEGRTVDVDDPSVASELAELQDGPGANLDAVWEAEWKSHLAEAALERVKRRVKPEQFQLFELSVLRNWPVATITKALGVSSMQVYLARHRVGKALREESRRIEENL